MGIKSYLREKKVQLQKDRAFNKKLNAKIRVAERETYQKEALKQAEKRGEARAKRGGFFKATGKMIYKKVTSPPRRNVSRRVVKRKSTQQHFGIQDLI